MRWLATPDRRSVRRFQPRSQCSQQLRERRRLADLGRATSPTPVVRGRDAELASIGVQLDRVRSGAGAVVLVEGEPGMGKTRLLAEAAPGRATARVPGRRRRGRARRGGRRARSADDRALRRLAPAARAIRVAGASLAARAAVLAAAGPAGDARARRARRAAADLARRPAVGRQRDRGGAARAARPPRRPAGRLDPRLPPRPGLGAAPQRDRASGPQRRRADRPRPARRRRRGPGGRGRHRRRARRRAPRPRQGRARQPVRAHRSCCPACGTRT